VTGFLGSGKTTFINTILNDQAHKLKIAIIENEFGEARILRVWAVPEQLRAWRAADLPHVLADWHRRRAVVRANGGERGGDEQRLHLLHRAQ
jgi:septin family protein